MPFEFENIKGNSQGDAQMKQAKEAAERLHEDIKPVLFNDRNILKDDSGAVVMMTYDEAMQYAKEHNSRIPTTRDVAMYMNPKAILEESQVDPKNIPYGYYRVGGINNGKTDTFYFNNEMEGKRKLEGEIAKLAFWNSTVALGATEYAHVFYGILGGGGGEKEDHLRSKKHAVLLLPITDK